MTVLEVMMFWPIVHHYLPQDFNIAIIDMLYLT